MNISDMLFEEVNGYSRHDKRFVNGYNQALADAMKIYNEMQPQLATHVYEFGERIKALNK